MAPKGSHDACLWKPLALYLCFCVGMVTFPYILVIGMHVLSLLQTLSFFRAQTTSAFPSLPSARQVPGMAPANGHSDFPTTTFILIRLHLHSCLNPAELDTSYGLTVLNFSVLLLGSKVSVSFVAILWRRDQAGGCSRSKEIWFVNLGLSHSDF